jgi:hypothetical protein
LSSVLGGLAINGKLIIIGASDELGLSPNFFFGHRSIVGWYIPECGVSRDIAVATVRE